VRAGAFAVVRGAILGALAVVIVAALVGSAALNAAGAGPLDAPGHGHDGWGAPGGSPASSSAPASALSPARNPIDHVVVVILENHGFDNYFGTYCEVLGSACSDTSVGLNLGVCHLKDPADPAAGCIRSFNFGSAGLTHPYDLAHRWVSSHLACDKNTATDTCRMDNFYYAEGNRSDPFGYLTGAQLPSYWDYAQQYALGDDMFASTLSYSLPNHWFMIAGAAPEVSEYYGYSLFCFSQTGANLRLEHRYLDEANATPALPDEVVHSSGPTWTYYDNPLPSSYDRSISLGCNGGAYSFWNPLEAKAESYSTAFRSHFVSRTRFAQDALAGRLPNVSWVIPTFQNSDHPPSSSVAGQAWVDSILASVEASPEWDHTAVFLTWDDYGGYYDSVPPPQVDEWGLSFRAPFLVISPYTPMNYVDPHFGYFESMLKFIEWRFGLTNLTSRDGVAPNLLSYFDFSASPRPALRSIAASTARYPMAFQSLPAPKPPLLHANATTDAVQLNWSLPLGGTANTGFLLTWGPSTDPTAHTMRFDRSVAGVRIPGLTSGVTYRFTLKVFAAPNLFSTGTTVSIAATAPAAWENADTWIPSVPAAPRWREPPA
jgi:phospholipase C